MRECSGGVAGQLEVSVDLLAHVLNNVQIKWEGLYVPICKHGALINPIIWYI